MQPGPRLGMHGILGRGRGESSSAGRLLIRPWSPIIAADAARGTSGRVVMGLVCVGGQKSGLLRWPVWAPPPPGLLSTRCVI